MAPGRARHGELLFLIAQYLQAQGLFASALTLQRESGLDVCWLRGASREVALLRAWVFSGDVMRARALLAPLARPLAGSDELLAAYTALDALELLQRRSDGRGRQETERESDVARARLGCFAALVPLFRAAVGPEEPAVFKYAAMPRRQLAALVALALRQQDTETDAVSLDCGAAHMEDEGDYMQASALFLVPPVAAATTRSVDWRDAQEVEDGRRHPLVLSVARGGTESEQEGGEKTETCGDEDVWQAALGRDAATQTESSGTAEALEDVGVQMEERGLEAPPQDEGVQKHHLAASWNDQELLVPGVVEITEDNQGPNELEPKVQWEQDLELRAASEAENPEEDDGQGEEEVVGEGEIEIKAGVCELEDVAPQRYDQLTLDHVVRARVVAEVREPHAVRALDVRPNGEELVVGTNARALRVFGLSDALSGQQERHFASSGARAFLPLLPVTLERHKHHASAIYCVSYNRHLASDTGAERAVSMIASGAADGSIKVLVTCGDDCEAPKEICIQRGDGDAGSDGAVGKTRALQFASPQLLWAATSNDSRLRCWDICHQATSSKCAGVVQTLDGHVGEVQALTMPESPLSSIASSVLLSAASDRTIRLWDTRTSRCQGLLASCAHTAFALHLRTTDETMAISGHQDGSLALWDLRASTRGALEIVRPHRGECRVARWSPDGRWLLSASFDGSLCVLRGPGAAAPAMLQPVASFHQHEGKVLQAQWHPVAPALASTGADKRVKLWSFA